MGRGWPFREGKENGGALGTRLCWTRGKGLATGLPSPPPRPPPTSVPSDIPPVMASLNSVVGDLDTEDAIKFQCLDEVTQWFSSINIPSRGLLEHRLLGPPPEVPKPYVWCGVCKSTLVTGSQGIWISGLENCPGNPCLVWL